MFEIGDFIRLSDGTVRFISNLDSERSVTLKTANKLYKEGKVFEKTILINGDEVFINIDELF